MRSMARVPFEMTNQEGWVYLQVTGEMIDEDGDRLGIAATGAVAKKAKFQAVKCGR